MRYSTHPHPAHSSRDAVARGRGRARRRWGAIGPAAALVAGLWPGSPAVAAPPSNDDVADAVVVSGAGFTATADTREATYVSSDPGCGAATVWYSFTPSADGRFALDTIGSNYDTMLAVLVGPPDDLDLVTCRYAAGNTRVLLKASAGTTYYVQAGTCCGDGEDGQVGPGGDLVFNVSAAPPQMKVGVTIRSRGVADKFGVARVRGTVSCNPSARRASITVQIRQRQGSRVVTAWAFRSVPCPPRGRTWTVGLEHSSRSFKRRPALVRVQASACDGFTCDRARRNRPVTLRAHW